MKKPRQVSLLDEALIFKKNLYLPASNSNVIN